MTPDDLKHTILAALAEVAPEVDPSTVDGDVPLRDQLDIDSMDFLNFAIALNERTGIEIPERDYPALTTLNGCVEYLARVAAPQG